MAKKSFAGGLDSLIMNSSLPENRSERLKSSFKKVSPESDASPVTKSRNVSSKKKSARVGVRDGAMKITFIINEDIVNKVRSLAHYNRMPIGKFMEEILSGYLKENAPN